MKEKSLESSSSNFFKQEIFKATQKTKKKLRESYIKKTPVEVSRNRVIKPIELDIKIDRLSKKDFIVHKLINNSYRKRSLGSNENSAYIHRSFNSDSPKLPIISINSSSRYQGNTYFLAEKNAKRIPIKNIFMI